MSQIRHSLIERIIPYYFLIPPNSFSVVAIVFLQAAALTKLSKRCRLTFNPRLALDRYEYENRLQTDSSVLLSTDYRLIAKI